MTLNVDTVKLRRLQAAIDQVPERLFGELRETLRNEGARWEGEMQNRTRRVLKRRTGSLARSIRQDVAGSDLRSLELRAATTSPYAKVHEYGTTGKGGVLPSIVPKRAKFLTVPIGDNLTPAGVPRYPSAAALRGQGTFLLKTASGKTFIVRREGEQLRWLWVLVKKVDIPPRLGFFATWRSRDKKRRAALQKAVVSALTGGPA